MYVTSARSKSLDFKCKQKQFLVKTVQPQYGYYNNNDFILDGTNITCHLPKYHSLRDKHLCNYYLNNKMRQHLEKMKIITTNG